MKDGPRILGLICARGGSKGIPRKSVCMLRGKPLLAWAIETALNARSLERVVVSTEDPEIAAVARRYSAEVPFVRPTEMAQETTPGIEPVLHAVTWFEEHERYSPELVVLLQLTSPLTAAGDIEAAIDIALANDADSVVSICEARHHPYSTYRLNSDGTLTGFLGIEARELDKRYPRRQDLPVVYVENGAIHLAKRSALLQYRSLYGPRIFGYVMPPERSLDIDTPWDLRLAECLLCQEVSNESDQRCRPVDRA